MIENGPGRFAGGTAARVYVPFENFPVRASPASSNSARSSVGQLVLLAFALAVSAAIWSPVAYVAVESELATGMTLILGIMYVGIIFGTKSALAASCLTTIFFALVCEPGVELRWEKGESLGPPLLFAAVATASALLSGRLRGRTNTLRLERGRLSTMLEASRRLKFAANAQALSRVLDQEVDPICAIERAQLTSILKEANAEKCSGQFRTALLGSLGHDLRTPLTVIGTAASGLLDHGEKFEPATSQAMLRTILAESRRLNRLSSRLLDLGCHDPSKTATKDAPISITQIVSERVRDMRQHAPTHLFELYAPEVPVMGTGDEAMLDIALTNVMENAVRYSPPGSTISVCVIRRSATYSVCVIDEGCGIPPGDMPRIFDPAYRGNHTRNLYPGSGLGLFVARTLMDFQGGSIEIQSPVKDHRGTAVTIELPLLQGDTVQ